MSLPLPGPIASEAARRSQEPDVLSVREEEGENRGRYVEKYLSAVGAKAGSPWCGAFVAYRLIAAASETGFTIPRGFPLSAWTPDYKAWAISKGLWIPRDKARDACKPGDIACFWFVGKDRIAHVGLLVGKNPESRMVTVEGNTGPGGSVNEVVREGDGVYKKARLWSDLGAHGGLVRLPF